MKSIIAVVGISGVGKSTLVRQAGGQRKILHLTASELIKSEQHRRQVQDQTSEELRAGPVLDNQSLLIAAFERATLDAGVPIVFDGHTTIDAPTGLVEIPTEVFRRIGVQHLVFVEDAPEEIARRRTADVSRSRPERSAAQLQRYQEVSKAAATRISTELSIPLTSIGPGELASLLSILT